MAELTDYALWDKWIETVLRDSYLPAVQSAYVHQDLLDIAWENFIGTVGPLVAQAKTSLLREYHDITLVAGQPTYDIPEHAMLGVVRLAHLLDTTGRIGKLHRREVTEDEFFFMTTAGHPIGIRVHDKQIELNPAPSAADILVWPTLRTWIWRRPGRFVRATDDGSGNNPARAARVLTSIAGTVTYTGNMPSSFDTDSEHDFFKHTAPYRRIATAAPATGVVGTDAQTFAAATAALVTAGDYVCLKNETCLMPVPVEMGVHLRNLTVRTIARTQADKEAHAMAQTALQEEIKVLFPAIVDRLPGNPLIATLNHSPFMPGRRGGGMVRD